MYNSIISSEQIKQDVINIFNRFKNSAYRNNMLISSCIDDLIIIRSVVVPEKIKLTEDAVKTLKSSKEALYMSKFSEAESLANPQAIFERYAELAIKSSKEYDYPAFYSGLMRGAQNPHLFTIVPLKNFKCRVIINMDKVYGRLEDYGKAVTAARNIQGIGKKDILSASFVWANKIYAVAREGGMKVDKERSEKYEGKYEKTIGLRVAHSIGLAPWWELLDKGNINVSIPGNTRIGGNANAGIPYPQISPTNFVNEAKTRIKESIQYLWELYYNRSKESIERTIKELESDLIPLRKINTTILKIIDYLRSFLGQGVPPPGKLPYKKPEIRADLFNEMLQIVTTRMKLRKNFVEDVEGLKILANRILSYYYDTGSVIGSIRGGGYRTRTITIVKEFEQRLKELSIK